MDNSPQIDKEISDAEAALKQAEALYGQNHEKVACCLDTLARLLRSRGVRALDAANMDARARAVRTRCSLQQGAFSRHMVEIAEARTITSKRTRVQRRRRAILVSVCVVAIAIAVGKLLMAPSHGERALVQDSMKKVESVLPTTYVQNVVTQGKAAVDSAQTANDRHNKQLEGFMEQ